MTQSRTHRFLTITAQMIAALSLLVLSQPARAEVKMPRVTVRDMVLPNGLHAYMVENHLAPVVSVQIWYHVGSKNEVPGRTGFAHLFEHLMFDGTKDVGPGEFSNYIVRAGGIDNAYTTEDDTVFWETIPNSDLPVALWLEADRMRNLRITKQLFDNERKVVEEERRQRFDNQPYGDVIEALYREAFRVHPYRHMPIGSMTDLNHATVGELRHFYDTYYVPNNAAVVIVGDYDWRKAFSLVKKYFEKIPAGQPINRNIPQEPPQTSERKLKLNLKVGLPAFVEGYHMPADGTPDAYPLQLISKILSDGESSRLYQQLIYKKQIALEAQATGSFTEDPNLFLILVIMNRGHSPAEGEADVRHTLDRLKRKLVAPAELTKAKNMVLRDYILNRQTDRGQGQELGHDAVILKNPELVNRELARFMAVTSEDIERVAQRYFTPHNMSLVEVYPQTSTQARTEKQPEKAGN